MTFFGRLPSSARCTASSARTAASISAFVASRATVTSARFLPLTWTGSVIVFSTSSVGARPAGQALAGDQGVVAERGPAFLGQMRHHRVKQSHHDLGRLAHRPGEVGRAGVGLAIADAERIGELVDMRDADVEVQLLDRRPTPWRARHARPCGPPAPARRMRPAASAGRLGGNLGGLADQPPQPVGEAPGALHAALGPFDVALGRRIRQHEPARHVGAVGRHDVVGVDGVPLRLRHLLDAADLDRLAGGEQRRAARSPSAPSIFTSAGVTHSPFALLIGLVHHHALREQAGERLVEADVAGRSSSRG